MTPTCFDRLALGTSLIGGIAETQEVLDFCQEHGIASAIKIIRIDELNDAFEQLDEAKADFRYVIDMASLKGKTPAEETLTEKLLTAVQ